MEPAHPLTALERQGKAWQYRITHADTMCPAHSANA